MRAQVFDAATPHIQGKRMAETANIADVALAISKDIFRHFRWHAHPKKDDNFTCLIDTHKGQTDKNVKTHPTDIVLSYADPYLGRRIHLLTDLKSYGGSTITHTKIRAALRSLAQSVECAGQSEQWREKFGVIQNEPHEVRGLLFVHNHDGEFRKSFYEEMRKVNSQSLPLPPNSVLHFLGPDDIQRLYTTANDILRLKAEKEIDDGYTFYYPDLVLRRRQGDVWDQAATFESLAGPFLVIKHKKTTNSTKSGYVVYYNRPGSKVEEFEYLLDCFSRYQLLDSDESIKIRVVHPGADADLKSRFDTAVRKYARAWGFDETRQHVLEQISIERVTAVTSNYNPGDMGWR